MAYLLAERQAFQVEVRYTYDVPHIPAEFKRAEYLGPAGRVIAGRYMFRVSWDGSLKVKGILAASQDDDVRECELADLNIRYSRRRPVHGGPRSVTLSRTSGPTG